MQETLMLLAVFVYAAGGMVCHQMPERSFFWGEWPFPVCARCTGLYLSAGAGLVGWAVVRLRRLRPIPLERRLAMAILGTAALPTLVSLATQAAGGWDAGNAGRALLAVPLGVTAGAVVGAVVTKDLR